MRNQYAHGLIARAVRVSILGLLFGSLCACQQLFKAPQVDVRSVDVTAVSFSGIGADVVFAVHNPNALGLDLARLAYELTVDGHSFVQGSGDHKLHVPAGGTGELRLPVAFKFADLAQSLSALFQKRELPFAIQSKLGFGTPLGVLDVPLSYSGKFPVPQLPDVSLSGAQLGDVDLTGATLATTIHVKNKNAFPLPIGQLLAGLNVNGVSLANVSTPPQKLGANASVPMTVNTRIDYLKAGLGVVKAVKSRSAKIALDGGLELLGYKLPVKLQTTLR